MIKLSALILSALLMCTSAAPTAETNPSTAFDKAIPVNKVENSGTSADKLKKPYFGVASGLVKKITSSDNGSKYVLIEDKKNKEVNIIITKDTYVINGENLDIGVAVSGYYDANAPALMIYPPQYAAEVFVVECKDYFVAVKDFGSELISSDKAIKLNVTETKTIISKDGVPFTGTLENKKLIVFYTVSTKSLPAIVNPSKIIVLGDLPIVTEETKITDILTQEIRVNGKKISAPTAFKNEKGVIMVPVSAISQALGLTVNWNSKNNSFVIGQNITITEGQDSYVRMKESLKLGTAPIVYQDKTYVPLDFFTKVVKVKTAKLTDTAIVIDR